MARAWSVVACIDSPTPSSWVKILIDRLQRREGLTLQVVLRESGNTDQNTACGLTDRYPASLLGRLAGNILQTRIDKPLFSQDPWKSVALGAAIEPALVTATSALPACDVIINLTNSILPDTLCPEDGTPVWDAHVDTLDGRIRDALLNRATLNWVHLWSHHRGHGDDATRARYVNRIATHALPRQSYSLTDLRRAAYFSLVTLFESRLVWLSRGVDIVQNEYSPSAPLANAQRVDPERQAAHAQADWLQDNDFMPPVSSEVNDLKRTLSLWFHQSIDRISHRLWYEQWQLGFLQAGAGVSNADAQDLPGASKDSSVPELTRHALADFSTVDSPDKTWWADPHLYRHEGSLYVFFEEMQIDADHGHLSVARLSDQGHASEVMKILDDGQHLSYPFVFSANDDVYMIPETASRKAVLLYRAERFPERWTLVKELLTGADLADSTVHFDGQRWWMFTNAMSHRCIDERDELHLYFADDIVGPWSPHPMNPIVTGVDRARMAGSVFKDGDRLYRPSQYGAVRYGYGINLLRIDVLNTETYTEVIVGRLLPEPGGPWLGCHSISSVNGATVLDRVVRHRR